MKKKVSMALVFALIGVLMGSVALAVAGRAGMLDFLGRYQSAYLPEDAQNYVQQSEERFDADVATVSLRELYYDGRVLRVTADLTPSDPKTLLAGVDSWPGQSWQELTRLSLDGQDESDRRTIADVYREKGYACAYNVNLSTGWDKVDSPLESAQDFVLGEDGVLTVFGEFEFADDAPERDFDLLFSFSRYETDETGALIEKHEPTPLKCLYPLHLTAAASEREGTGVYVSTAPADFSSIGVRVDRVAVTVKPMELYYTIEGTVTDGELYKKTDDGLFFEFIDPEKTVEAPADQRLSSGLTSSESCTPPDPDGRFIQEGTLGANELRDAYALRAYECWEKQRFDTCELEMRPATAEEAAQIDRDIAALRSSIEDMQSQENDGDGNG